MRVFDDSLLWHCHSFVHHHAAQSVRVVGDDAIDAEVDQPAHLRWIVHGPRKHFEAEPVRFGKLLRRKIAPVHRPHSASCRFHRRRQRPRVVPQRDAPPSGALTVSLSRVCMVRQDVAISGAMRCTSINVLQSKDCTVTRSLTLAVRTASMTSRAKVAGSGVSEPLVGVILVSMLKRTGFALVLPSSNNSESFGNRSPSIACCSGNWRAYAFVGLRRPMS